MVAPSKAVSKENIELIMFKKKFHAISMYEIKVSKKLNKQTPTFVYYHVVQLHELLGLHDDQLPTQ